METISSIDGHDQIDQWRPSGLLMKVSLLMEKTIYQWRSLSLPMELIQSTNGDNQSLPMVKIESTNGQNEIHWWRWLNQSMVIIKSTEEKTMSIDEGEWVSWWKQSNLAMKRINSTNVNNQIYWMRWSSLQMETLETMDMIESTNGDFWWKHRFDEWQFGFFQTEKFDGKHRIQGEIEFYALSSMALNQLRTKRLAGIFHVDGFRTWNKGQSNI